MIERLKKYQNKTHLGILDQMVVSGGNFMTGLLLARWLGLEQFGVFTLLWMIVLFALSLNMALITKPLLTLIAKHSTSASYLGSVHSLQLLLAFLGGLLTFLLGSAIVQFGLLEVAIPLLIGTAFLVTNQLLYDFYRKCFYATGQIHTSLLLDSLLYGLQIVGMGMLYTTDLFTLPSVLGLMVITQAITLFIFAFQVPSPILNLEEIQTTAIRHLRFSGWLSLTAMMQWFTANYFIIAAGGILGTAMVGLIRIVQQLIGLIHILFLAMENLLPTAAAKRLQEGGTLELLRFLKGKTVRWVLPFAFAGLLYLLLSPWIIDVFFNADLNGNFVLLFGYLGLYVLVFLSIPIRIYFRTIEHTRPLFLAYLAATVVSFLAAPILLTQYGITGFVLGLILVQVIMIAIYLIEYQSTKTSPSIIQADLN